MPARPRGPWRRRARRASAAPLGGGEPAPRAPRGLRRYVPEFLDGEAADAAIRQRSARAGARRPGRLPRDRRKGVADDQIAKARDRRRHIAVSQILRAFVVELLSTDLQERIIAVATGAEQTERRNAEMNLRELQREVTRLQNDYREDLNLRQNEEMSALQVSLLQEIQSYAAQEGYDLIVGDGVLYASGAVNITEQVLRAVEANFQATSAAQ